METNFDLGVKRAVKRRLQFELGIRVSDIDSIGVVDKIQYTAMDNNGFGE